MSIRKKSKDKGGDEVADYEKVIFKKNIHRYPMDEQLAGRKLARPKKTKMVNSMELTQRSKMMWTQLK